MIVARVDMDVVATRCSPIGKGDKIEAVDASGIALEDPIESED